jgi:hypothetical protein
LKKDSGPARMQQFSAVSNGKLLSLEVFRWKNQSCGLQPEMLLGTSLERDVRDTPSRSLFFHCYSMYFTLHTLLYLAGYHIHSIGLQRISGGNLFLLRNIF